MGSRFTPCMREISDLADQSQKWPCPNSTRSTTDVCSLSELCGMGGVDSHPNQVNKISEQFLKIDFLNGD